MIVEHKNEGRRRPFQCFTCGNVGQGKKLCNGADMVSSPADQLRHPEQVVYPREPPVKQDCLYYTHSLIVTLECDNTSIKHQPPPQQVLSKCQGLVLLPCFSGHPCVGDAVTAFLWGA